MKNLLSGDRQLTLTRIAEALEGGNLILKIDSYLAFDPCAPKSGC